MEEQRQLNKIFLQDFCNSDYIISPIDKHETQRSSVRVLHFKIHDCIILQNTTMHHSVQHNNRGLNSACAEVQPLTTENTL